MLSANIMIRPLSALGFALALSACFSGKSQQSSGSSAGGMSAMERRMLKPDMEKVSPYEKAFNTTSAGDRGLGKFLGGKSVTGRTFGGQKAFNTGNFHTKEFDQGKRKSTFGTQASRYGSESNRMGRGIFKTGESDLARQDASQGSKVFQRGNRNVEARSFAPAEKSLSDNKRPMIMNDPSAPQEKVAYTEDEIQRLLGR